MPVHPLFKGMKGSHYAVSYYSNLLHELTPYIKPGNLLISFDCPDANALLSCPPFLKWKGGATSLTSPESLKEQLSTSKKSPVILIPRSQNWQNGDGKLKCALEFANSHPYSRIETRNYIIYLPAK